MSVNTTINKTPLNGQSIEEWASNVYSTVSSMVKASTLLDPNDVNFYRSSESDFSKQVDDAASQLLQITNTILGHVSGKEGMKYLSSVDSVTDDYDQVVDLVDNLLEKTVGRRCWGVSGCMLI
jgi:hypothetical protein